ncbi:hypothetical protein GMES_1202 [Paraglaciecola mesophila KMM 241]|uniref:Uncharacterized protein n=1 Tax=Paraglaciecola mesophila KMM 241 TaxID=1128912 RepID=K6YHP3_9ALTE|nr:hypothetical protein GMES_1202 [Paraglaciecola mesophila KMM 241]
MLIQDVEAVRALLNNSSHLKTDETFKNKYGSKVDWFL